MGLRRDGREAAVQYLFFADINSGEGMGTVEEFWHLRGAEHEVPKKGVRDFAFKLIEGVLQNREQLDQIISQYSQNYHLQRISAVDRNILRLALYEMTFDPDIPYAVCINEAIEIAKKFGTDESGRFVNGILDRAKKEMPQKAPGSKRKK